mmetsp:Transcript_4579/g.8939  ORF Transcript_4579/g.8939 Transcript_4579/m.8939 type:complete len:154 (+) Transcript_4579:162-623(+)
MAARSDEAVRRVLSVVKGGPVNTRMLRANVQRNPKGDPYSVNIILDDEDGESSILKLKKAFLMPSGCQCDLTRDDTKSRGRCRCPECARCRVHDRYYPRTGHITMVSVREAPDLFKDETRLGELLKRLNAVVEGKKAHATSIRFPDNELKLAR